MANIYYSDMDGTLLNAEGRLGSEQRARLHQLISDGVRFSVATGRNMHAIQSELGELAIELPVIENNGSYLSDYRSGEKLLVNYFPHDHLDDIMEEFFRSDTSPIFLYFEDGIEKMFTPRNQLNEGMLAFREFRQKLGDEVFDVVEDLRLLPRDGLVNLQAIGREDEIRQIEQRLAQFPEHYEVHSMHTYGGWWYVNIASHDSSKAHGIERVRGMIAPEDRMIVFGDNVNDIPMLKVADISIAMSNALPEVKAVADLVIGDHRDDAVIAFMEQHRNDPIHLIKGKERT